MRLHLHGDVVSKDADFVLQSNVRQKALDEALRELERRGDRYVHPEVRLFIEFPPGPLSIGEDLAIRPVELTVAGIGPALALSATDSCRDDRLAAFYHWNDRQGLRLAVEIARKQAVDLDAVKAWSINEGMVENYEEFVREVRVSRGRRSKRTAR
ncbi:MAG: hypothetical protein ACM3NQ_24070 [Bacteroidales bacterium]